MKKSDVIASERHPFVIIELVGAMIIVMLLTAGFYSGLRLLLQMEKRFARERAAITVLDNVIERLTVLPDRAPARIRELAEDEFDRSRLAEMTGIHLAVGLTSSGETELEVETGAGRSLAHVTVPN